MPRSLLLKNIVVLALVVAGCSDPAEDARDSDGADNPAAATTTVGGEGSIPSASSAGCEVEVPESGESAVTVTSGGVDRSYLRYIPEGLKSGAAAPLIIDFPAYSPAELETSFSGFTKPDADGEVLADRVGAIVVTPEPVNGAGSLLTWNYVGTDGWTDDRRFVADLLDDVGGDACIDEDRVLATGFAVGAVFASIVACEMPGRFAALATVSGLYDPETCDASAALPVVSFHGTGDRFIPFDGGVGDGAANLGLSDATTAGLVFMAQREGAPESSTGWAERGGCDPEPVVDLATDTSGGGGVSRTIWTDCDAGIDVELYVIDQGEHTWPGSVGMNAYTGLLGPVSNTVDASQEIWDFFQDHT